jgi:hypothetical protein
VPTFRICIVNSDFRDCEDTHQPDAQAARKQALKGALQIGSDEIANGSAFFGAEISVACEGEVLERLMIAIGASTLR